jgi:hypothetical protein
MLHARADPAVIAQMPAASIPITVSLDDDFISSPLLAAFDDSRNMLDGLALNVNQS